MAILKSTIREWLRRGKEGGNSHTIIICDTFDWDDYPVYCRKPEHVETAILNHNGRNMQKVMEVYDLNKDLESQLNEHRAWHVPN